MFPFSQKTKDQVQQALATGHHAIIIVGDPLIGLEQLDMHIKQTVGLLPGNEYTLTADKASIGIEQIKTLKQQLKTAQATGVRVVSIDSANSMTTEAQNALLKLLEEPGSDTLFVLGAPTRSGVLQTIFSRCQVVQLFEPSMSECETFAHSLTYQGITQQQALMMCRDRPGYLQKLSDDAAFAEVQLHVFKDAKLFLQSDTFTKLALSKAYKERTKALELISALQALIMFQMNKTGSAGANAVFARKLEEVEFALHANAGVQGQLQRLCL